MKKIESFLVINSPKWRSSLDEQSRKFIRKNSHSDEPFSLSRLSLHSISYGFGGGIKARQSTPSDQLSPGNTYRLPSNKIELDSNQQELLRRSGSFRKEHLIQ